MNSLITLAIVITTRWLLAARHHLYQAAQGDDRGEGVISAAIAVLVMAFLGAVMWVGFKALFQEAQGNIHNQVKTIGS